jgi:hypothetical protein
VIGVVADAAERCLVARLHEVDTLEVLRWAAAEHAAAVDGNDEARTWGRGGRGASLAQLHQQNSTAAHAVLELAARQRVDIRRRPPTRRDFEAMAVLAQELWRWRRVASQVECRLRAVDAVRLTRRGTFDAEVVDAPPFRMSRYEQRMAGRVVDRNSMRGADDAQLVRALRAATTDGAAVPDELRELDEAMQADRSYGLADLLLALELLVLASGSGDPSVSGYRFRSDGVAAMVRDNVPTFSAKSDSSRVVEAARRLTWTQELLLESPLQVLEDRTSVARLYSRPVIELSDRDLFVPRHAPGLARVVFVQRIVEGTWPEQLMPTDARIAAALERRRGRVRPVEGFESHLADVIVATGLPHALNVRQSGPSRNSGLLGVCVRTEIDAIVVSADARTIWVVEAKDLAMPIAPRRVRSELDKYFRPGGHVAKLTEKVNDIEADPREVVRRLGGGLTSEPPEVKGVFVTREPSPAWFHDEQVHICITVDALPAFLGN